MCMKLVVCEDVDGEKGRAKQKFCLQGHHNFCLITVLGKHFCKWKRAFASAKLNCFSLKAALALQSPSPLQN